MLINMEIHRYFTINLLACLFLLLRTSAGEQRTMTTLESKDTILTCLAIENVTQSDLHKYLKKLEWSKNNAVIASYNRGKESAEWWLSDPRFILDRFKFALTVASSMLSDRGHYVCTPYFYASFRSKSLTTPELIEVDVIGPPSPPGRPVVASYTSRTATVTWDKSVSHPEAPVLLYRAYAAIGKVDMNVYKEAGTSAGNVTSLTVANLTPYTVYRFYVSSENFAGSSPFSQSSFAIRTKGEAPIAEPKIRHVSNSSNTSVLITWDHPPSHALHGQLAGYRIIVRQPEGKQRAEHFIPKSDVNSFEITGLKIYTRYVISLEADNNFGYSPASTVNIITSEGVPSNPTILSLKVLSPDSVDVTWHVPNATNGIIIRYSLYWTPYSVQQDSSYFVEEASTTTMYAISESTTTISCKNLTKELDIVNNYTIKGLTPYTRYKIWIVASTSTGASPPSDVGHILTDTSAPGECRILNLTAKDSDVVYLQWTKPDRFYRRVDFYTITVRRIGNRPNEFGAILVNTSDNHIFMSGLEPSVRYFVGIRAITRSIVVSDRLYVGRESEQEAFFVQPASSHHSTKADTTAAASVILRTSVCTSGFSLPISVVPLSSNTAVKTTSTDSGHFSTIFCDFSLKYRILQENSSFYYATGGETALYEKSIADYNKNGRRSMIVVVVLGSFAFLAVVVLVISVLFVIWKRYFAKKHYKFDGLSSTIAISEPDVESYDGLDSTTTIPIELFEEHVKKLRADGGIGFAREYEEIERQSVMQVAGSPIKLTWKHSLLNENRPKNRYVNILAYDQTRVRLRRRHWIKCSDYINANYIDGFRQNRAYIATQGPLPDTFNDFWRMVWEQRCVVIVMITNVIERGRKKCDQYWPDEGEENYGHIIVRLLSEYVTAFYTVRIFVVRNKKLLSRGEDRIIMHYHYTRWPDHGVPDCATPVLSFIRKSSAVGDSSAPIVVHCSAGVGRSGTYMVIDAMLKRIVLKNSVNIFGYLQRIRRQRNFLVQTEEQYAFCFEALLEAIKTGKTEVDKCDFRSYIVTALTRLLPDGSTLLHYQHQLLQEKQDLHLYSESMKSINRSKIRKDDVITTDPYRVTITPKPGEKGTDYINATFLPGFRNYDEFIVTQLPTDETVCDFWQMIFDQNVPTIIILLLITSEDEQLFQRLLPVDERNPWNFGPFIIHLQDRTKSKDWLCMDLKIKSKQDEFSEQTCRLLRYTSWPQPNECPKRAWTLVQWVRQWQWLCPNVPLVVVDRLGACQAACFCAMVALSCQLEQEGTADVYQIAKLYCRRRSGLFLNFDDYYFLYKAVDALLESDSDFNDITNKFSQFGAADQNHFPDTATNFIVQHPLPLFSSSLMTTSTVINNNSEKMTSSSPKLVGLNSGLVYYNGATTL